MTRPTQPRISKADDAAEDFTTESASDEGSRWFRLRGDARETELVLPLSDGPNPVGTDPSNAVILDHDGVSRHHAVVVVDPKRLMVIDEESKNGTFVNGRRVRQRQVSAGDRISFGPVALRLESVHPEDAQLALEVQVPETRPPPTATSDSTTVSYRVRGGRRERDLGAPQK